MNILYKIYQIIIAAPLIILATILTSVTTVIGCLIGNPNFWGYYPGKCWSMFICRILLLPVHVTGYENIRDDVSYVFVANHQGAFDIFLIYGFLCHNFKWMMKQELRNMPFVGIACAKARHIFVDRSSPHNIKKSIDTAHATLQDGISLVVFPEGSRTRTGEVGRFKKGAYLLANDLKLPIVPITINGSFNILPRTKGLSFVHRTPLSMTIHKPIPTTTVDSLEDQITLSRDTIIEGLRK